MIASDYIKELLIKFPDSGDRTIANLAIKKQPKLFISFDTCRNMVKYYRGHNGKKSRSLLKDKQFIKPVKTSSENVWGIPASHSQDREVWRLPKSIKKVLLLSDIHFPYHDVKALETALKYGKKEGIDAIFINGDMIDFYQLSFHEKDPRVTDIAEELEMARNFFALLQEQFPKVLVYYIPGNHEYRMERYLRVKAPELLDMKEFKLDVLLRVREFGVHYIEHGTKCYFGKLLVEHGDKMKGSGGVNPARSLFAKLKRHAICGHFHRTSEATEKVYDGDVVVTYSTGCLCELEPRYMEVNNHNHGFAIVDMDGENFAVSNKKIVNGKVY
jgi:predicted phosphodiesterase